MVQLDIHLHLHFWLRLELGSPCLALPLRCFSPAWLRMLLEMPDLTEGVQISHIAVQQHSLVQDMQESDRAAGAVHEHYLSSKQSLQFSWSSVEPGCMVACLGSSMSSLPSPLLRALFIPESCDLTMVACRSSCTLLVQPPCGCFSHQADRMLTRVCAMSAEVQPLETRSAGQSITTMVNLMFSFVIGQTYLTMLCAFRWGAPPVASLLMKYVIRLLSLQ